MSIEEIKELLRSGQLEDARRHLLQLVESDPDNPRGWLLLSGFAMRELDWTLGERVYRALIKLRPTHYYSSSGLVHCLMELDRPSEAISEISRFASVADPQNSDDLVVLEEHQRVLEYIKGRTTE